MKVVVVDDAVVVSDLVDDVVVDVADIVEVVGVAVGVAVDVVVDDAFGVSEKLDLHWRSALSLSSKQI